MAKTEKVKTSTKSNTVIAATVGTSAVCTSAIAMANFANIVGPQKLEDLIAEPKKRVKAVNDGELAGVEAILIGQAIALQSIFANFASRSALNAGEHLHATETYMKHALRAQRQCRATLETLAMIKSPPMVYARQANVTTGPQQINNGVAREIQSEQTQLLEARHGEQLDTGEKGQAGRADAARGRASTRRGGRGSGRDGADCFSTTNKITLGNGKTEEAVVTSCRTPDGWVQV